MQLPAQIFTHSHQNASYEFKDMEMSATKDHSKF